MLLFTKPPHPGKVKTRLIGELSAEQAAAMHRAFLGDVSEQLAGGRFRLCTAWALAEEEDAPHHLVAAESDHVAQAAGDLGDRLFAGLQEAAEEAACVGAIGSDHPELGAEQVEEAFRRVERGADVVFGPSFDGGYYLIALARAAVRRELFAGIPWSTPAVLEASLERCRELGLIVEQLEVAHDIDFVEDLRGLADRLKTGAGSCRRTRALLEDWGWLPPVAREETA
ncbi:MAG: TIGR04282 family arsenosugar biosynthesis glycosyltransferase [Acidobacteriota bacterium]